MLTPLPQSDGIWRWGLWEINWFRREHEDGALAMESVSLEDTMRELALFLPPLCVDTARRQLSASQEDSSPWNQTVLTS